MMRLCVLGSGSVGNCSLVTLHGCKGHSDEPRHLLIDTGLSPRQTRKRLAGTGITLHDINDVLITHFDTDHFHPGWVRVIEKNPIRVHTHRRQQSDALKAGLTGRNLFFTEDGFELEGGTSVETMLLAHDDVGTVGYVIEHDGTRLGYATDLGRVPNVLLDRFINLHGLAIESNYDRAMQVASNRPAFLKRRIMGGMGHLSNKQSFQAAQHIAQQSDLSHLVLLHLSRQCNDPTIIKRLYHEQSPDMLNTLTISNQFTPTPVLKVSRNGQTHPIIESFAGEQSLLF